MDVCRSQRLPQPALGYSPGVAGGNGAALQEPTVTKWQETVKECPGERLRARRREAMVGKHMCEGMGVSQHNAVVGKQILPSHWGSSGVGQHPEERRRAMQESQEKSIGMEESSAVNEGGKPTAPGQDQCQMGQRHSL
ncbi:UNVERIFIED_CONTAM: hypothetical protein K2H54_062128 [Gekko kuhli]